MNELLNAADPPDKPEDNEATAAVQSNAQAIPQENHPSFPSIQKNKAIRVFIADDHPLVRKGIRQCINDDRDMEVVGESGTALGVFEFLSRDKCDVLVLDIGLPDKTGLDVLGVLKKTHPALPVLILSMYPHEQFSKLCLAAGATGFISKSDAPAQLVGAIRQAARGSSSVAPMADGTLAPPEVDARFRAKHKALSQQDFHIFCQIVAGQPLKVIASQLGVTVSTITRHRAKILKTMGMTSNQEIIEYAQKHQLCD